MKKRSLAALGVTAVLVGGLVLPAQAVAPAAPAAPAAPSAAPVYRFVISQADAGASDASRNAVANRVAAMADAKVEATRVMATGGLVVSVDKAIDGDQLAADAAAAGIEVTPDFMLQAAAAPNDPMYADQWHYDSATKYNIRLARALDITDGRGVVVAVGDTGVTEHPDLYPNTIAGYDFLSDAATGNDGDGRDPDARDPGDNNDPNAQPYEGSSWHGTHVAGTIAAVTNNGVGVAGIAGGAKHQPVRMLGVGGGSWIDIADGIVWSSGGAVEGVPANPTPAKVLNLSLGSYVPTDCPTELSGALNTAKANGTVILAAAGNEWSDAGLYPLANCGSAAIVVGALAPDGSLAAYSNYGNTLHLSAPGGDQWRGANEDGVLSTLNDGFTAPENSIYEYYNGTSMATPHVAGVVALMRQVNPFLNPDDIQLALVEGAKLTPVPAEKCVGNPMGLDEDANPGTVPPIPNAGCGWGALDAVNNVTAVGGFTDVPAGTPFQYEIAWLAWHGITKGWWSADNTREFAPTAPVHRDAFAAFLYRAAGSPDFTAPATPTYDDVAPTDAFYKEIEWTAANGISFGWETEDGLFFRPLDNIQRDAMAAFLYRYANANYTDPATPTFTDVAVDNPFYTEIEWLASEQITTGWADGTYRPTAATQRDAVAAFFYRADVAGQLPNLPAGFPVLP